MPGADLGTRAPPTAAENATAPQNIACPFSKHPVLKHLHPDCRGLTLRGIADLKLHFHRRHKQAPFCIVCKLVFPGDNGHAQCDAHIKEQACRSTEGAEPPGYSLAELSKLFPSKRKRGSGPEQLLRKWHHAWDTLFPGTSRPPSIFHQCSGLQEWLEETVERYLRSSVLSDLLKQESRTLGVANDALSMFTGQLLGDFRQHASQPARPGPLAAPDTSRPDLSAARPRPSPATGTNLNSGTSGTVPPDPNNQTHDQNLTYRPPATVPTQNLMTQTQPEITEHPTMASMYAYLYPSFGTVGRRSQPASPALTETSYGMPGVNLGVVPPEHAYQAQPQGSQGISMGNIDPELLCSPELPVWFPRTGPEPGDDERSGN
ncbi:hypothetical protein QBC43DRAFT_361897 [Cladorrhinum sp. PSN259]|nr:hypothetical protein QBC43DRAFT_361897 [Cladorrhinum sp. PSN259]